MVDRFLSLLTRRASSSPETHRRRHGDANRTMQCRASTPCSSAVTPVERGTRSARDVARCLPATALCHVASTSALGAVFTTVGSGSSAAPASTQKLKLNINRNPHPPAPDTSAENPARPIQSSRVLDDAPLASLHYLSGPRTSHSAGGRHACMLPSRREPVGCRRSGCARHLRRRSPRSSGHAGEFERVAATRTPRSGCCSSRRRPYRPGC